MSFKAVLSLEDKEYEVLECISEMEQIIDQRGKAVSAVRGGDLRLVLQGTGEETIPAWALNKDKKYSGSVTFLRMDGQSKFRQLKFENGYLTWFAESFMAGEVDENYDDALVFETDFDEQMYKMVKKAHRVFGSDYLMICKISAQKVTIDEVEHDNRW